MMMKEIAAQDPWVREYQQIFIICMFLRGSFQYSRYNRLVSNCAATKEQSRGSGE